jgi:hypothetical protein
MADPRLRDELIHLLTRYAAGGFDAQEALPERVAAELEGEHSAERIHALATALLPEIIKDRQARQRTWPTVTDCDRLDAAFEELNALGIMARHHWYCCGNCGSSAMPHEFERLGGEWEGTPIVGYAFYHVQDTEQAAEGGSIFLGYGATDLDLTDAEDESASLTIACTICDVLAQHGLVTEWNGQLSQRILVKLDWKRRASPPRFTEDWSNR